MTRSIHPVPAARLLMLGAVLAAAAIACTARSDISDTSAAGAATSFGASAAGCSTPVAEGSIAYPQSASPAKACRASGYDGLRASARRKATRARSRSLFLKCANPRW